MAQRDPLVLPLSAFAVGVVAARLADFPRNEIVAATATLFALTLLARWKAPRAALPAMLAAFAFAGILTDILHRPGPPPTIDFTPGERLILSGCVIEPPVWSPDREQFILELDREAAVRVTLYPRDGDPPAAFGYGEMVEVDGRLRLPRNFGNPGAFDYAGYLARRDIHWTASGRSGVPVTRLGQPCGNRFRAALFALRGAALNRLDRLYSADPYSLGMARAVLVGDSSRLEAVWKEQYRRTGTYHALVISGLHLTTLAACLLFLLRICSASIGVSLAITTAAAWIYALVAGGNAPVVRAAAGLTLYLIARFFFRKPRVLNLLAAVAFCFLLADPEQLFDASFQLSFLAVFAIGALAVPLLDATTTPFARAAAQAALPGREHLLEPRAAQWLLEIRLLAETLQFVFSIPQRFTLRMFSLAARPVFFFIDLFIVSATVQLALTLPMAVYFHRVSFSGLSANLLVVPLMNLVVPIGFGAILTGWTPLARIAGWLLAASREITAWHSQLEPNWRIPDPPLWLVAAFLASLALLAFTLRARPRWRIAAAAPLIACLTTIVIHPFAPRLHNGLLEFTTVDVGQGDSLLVVSPQGKIMLIDGGGFPSYGRKTRSTFDVGEDVVSPYLWSRSIRRVDVIAFTHMHEDHTGGIPALLENFRPRELWHGGVPEGEQWNTIRDTALRLGIRIVARRAGDRQEWGGVAIDILSPPEDYASKSRPSNDDSLVMRLAYGANSFLLTGDAERRMEERMLDDGLLQQTGVLKIAHHGSKTSTTADFLDAVRPTFAVISDGEGNSFGHPNAEILSRLSDAGVQTWRTDLVGQVVFLSDGRRLRVEPAHWPIAQRPWLAPRAAF